MEPADFYSGIVVDAYAKLKSTSFEAGPYLAFVEEHGQPALEIGCGDGEPLLDLCAAGLDVDGVDSSADMVARCRDNAAVRGLVVDVHHQRVEALSLGRRYAAIYFAGPTFNLLADDAAASDALRAIGEHLTDGGAALIPLWIPRPTPTTDLGVTRMAVDAGVELRYTPVSETYDVASRTRVTRSRYERVTPESSEQAHREWIIHWHTLGSFTDLCEEAGLDVVQAVDDDTGDPASESSASFTMTVRSGRVAV